MLKSFDGHDYKNPKLIHEDIYGFSSDGWDFIWNKGNKNWTFGELPSMQLFHHPEYTRHLNGRTSEHFLLPGEILPLNFNGFPPVDHTNRVEFLGMISKYAQLGHLMEYPRLQWMLNLHTYHRDTGRVRNVGDLIRDWHQRTGEDAEAFSGKGWWKAFAPRASAGYDNGHYNGVLWHILGGMSYDADLAVALSMAMFHACSGRLHLPGDQFNGFARYEKGHHHIGQNWTPAIEKQWCTGLISAYQLTKCQLFKDILSTYKESLKSYIKRAWEGAGGSRRAARYIEELWQLAWFFNDKDCLDTIDRFKTQYIDKYLDGEWFPNAYSSNNETPWQDFQVVAGLLRAGYTDQKLIDFGERIWKNGTYQHNLWHTACRYRFQGPDEYRHAWGHHLLAFSIPMLRLMDHNEYKRVREQTYELIGWNTRTPQVPDIYDIGIDYAPQGFGFPKVAKYVLQSII